MQVALPPGNSTETPHTRAKLRVPPPQAVAAHPRLQHLRAAAQTPHDSRNFRLTVGMLKQRSASQLRGKLHKKDHAQGSKPYSSIDKVEMPATSY